MLKQYEAINAYRKLEGMTDIKFPATISFKVYKLKKTLGEFYEWQREEETRLFNDYGAQFDENNAIVLADPEKNQEFVDKLNGITNIEHEEFEKVVLPIGAFEMLSMKDIEELDPIIEFVE